jgi:hypothetical protein
MCLLLEEAAQALADTEAAVEPVVLFLFLTLI